MRMLNHVLLELTVLNLEDLLLCALSCKCTALGRDHSRRVPPVQPSLWCTQRTKQYA